MYLYIFQVDRGLTFTLDLNLTTETVKVLKENIFLRTGIPIDKQALLLSGGDTLFEDAKVSSYRSAGTETNPIFLFNKEAVDLENPPSPVIENNIDSDMKDRIKSCFNMEPSFNTVMTRAELAQQLYSVAQSHLECCEKLIQDQHLQHQGWAAVLANIEDLSKVVISKLDILDKEYKQFKDREPIYNQSIDRLQTDLEILNKMPLLPSLIEPSLRMNEKKETSLADWIGFRWNSLQDVSTMVNSVLQFQHKSHEDFMANVEKDKIKAIKAINSKEIKEISGLQNRLQMLDVSLVKATKLTNELNEFAQAFHQNHLRASNIQDKSILPDLCRTHDSQLQVIAEKYNELCDIRDRCASAKREFCFVIHRRLQWATQISRLISGLSHKQTLWVSSFHRMEKFINVFDQINRTPMVYLSYVGEIYRRRLNSQKFLTWANEVASQSTSFYDKEMELRKDFEEKTSQHFLKSLFHGMKDEPPLFAGQAPEPFDDKLPEITECDIKKLIDLFPQYRSLLETHVDVPFEPCKLNSSPKQRILSPSQEQNEICEPEQKEEPVTTTASASTNTTAEQDKISYFSCNEGDLVLLTFNTVHNCYVAFCNSPIPHFLHHDCLESLGFFSGETQEIPAYGFGIITEKQYCQASKPQNRYNVPINTRFYRFKAKPWTVVAQTRQPAIPLIRAPQPYREKMVTSTMSCSTVDQSNLGRSTCPQNQPTNYNN